MAALNTTDEVSTGDLIVLYKSANGDYRGMTAAEFLTYLEANLDFATATGVPQFETQMASPSATGFSVTIAPPTAGDNVHLILMPLAGYATGTIVLPAVANVIDKQEVLVNCTQAVTTLTVSGNGAVGVIGAPTALTANQFFKLKYDSTMQSWYRVG